MTARRLALRAGQLTSPRTRRLSVSNGRRPRPAHVTLHQPRHRAGRGHLVEQDRGFTPVGGQRRTASPGAPLQREPVDARRHVRTVARQGHDPLPSRDVSDNPAWSALPDYPDADHGQRRRRERRRRLLRRRGDRQRPDRLPGYAVRPDGRSPGAASPTCPSRARTPSAGSSTASCTSPAAGTCSGNLTSTTYAYDPPPTAGRASPICPLAEHVPPRAPSSAEAVRRRRLRDRGLRRDDADVPLHPATTPGRGWLTTRSTSSCRAAPAPATGWSAPAVWCRPTTRPHEFAGLLRLPVRRRLGHLDRVADLPYSRLGDGVRRRGRQTAARRRYRRRLDHQPGDRVRPRDRRVVAAAQRDVHHVPRRCRLRADPIGGSIGAFTASPYAEQLPGQEPLRRPAPTSDGSHRPHARSRSRPAGRWQVRVAIRSRLPPRRRCTYAARSRSSPIRRTTCRRWRSRSPAGDLFRLAERPPNDGIHYGLIPPALVGGPVPCREQPGGRADLVHQRVDVPLHPCGCLVTSCVPDRSVDATNSTLVGVSNPVPRMRRTDE